MSLWAIHNGGSPCFIGSREEVLVTWDRWNEEHMKNTGELLEFVMGYSPLAELEKTRADWDQPRHLVGSS